jgi:type II secretory pathway pseudopilin PulG
MASPASTSASQAPAATLRGRLRSADGLSLIEVTVMLVVLMALAGALVPVVGDTIATARMVRARNDLSQLAVALTNFQRDVGPIVFDGSRLRQPQTVSSLRIVDLLVSDGELPDVADVVPVETLAQGLFLDPSVGTGRAALSAWVTNAATDRCDLHLRINGRGYPESQAGPGTGWNGPYVGKPVAGDPWGHAYLINTGFLRGLPPRAGRCANCAVYAISAGPNGQIETPFQQPLANANLLGDDLAVRIQ